MSRPLRIQFPDAWYHVMNRGKRGEKIFTDKGDYRAFIDLLKDCVEMWNIRVAAYCLMGTHYHILFQTPDANLSRCMRHINGVYTQYFNRTHGLDGHLFRGRYKSILVDSDAYLLELLRYIHRNPIDAGMVDHLGSYPWSSHKGYLSRSEKWNWLHKNYVLKIFSNNKTEALKGYKSFVNKKTPEEINRILGSRKWPSVIGKDSFINWVKDTFFIQKRHVEVPESKSLAPDSEKIKRAVCREYDIDEEDLLISRRGITNEPRNMAIYLMRHLMGMKLEEIGREFGLNNYSSVSTVIERTKQKATHDRNLRKRIEKLKSDLNVSQEQT
ncbi:MAG: transposase [Deltaproteobacteria bacterium]|nr:transposase [Deltaproteobacteria bacterium]